MKVYVASSWRNAAQPVVVRRLLEAEYDVYDFRAPDEPGGTPGGFQWSEIDPEWKLWTPEEFREQLEHPLATHGAGRDLEGLVTSDVVLLVMPCGRSAHLELGYALGAGKIGIVYVPTDLEEAPWPESYFEPELMWSLAHRVAVTWDEVLAVLRLPRTSAQLHQGRVRRLQRAIEDAVIRPRTKEERT